MLVAPLLATVAFACPATPVHYGWNRETPADAAPWIASGRGETRIVGRLYTFEATLGDRRVREAPGVTLYTGALHKIAWLPRRWEGTGKRLTIAGRRLDGPGAFTRRFQRAVAPQFFPTGLTLPTAGCWQLTLRSNTRRWTLHMQAIEPPSELPCDTTTVRHGTNPVDEFFTTWIAATPRQSRIFGTFSVSLPGVEGGAIYAGGRFPDGRTNTKVLWLVDEPSGQLTITGVRLDAQGSFEQVERAAASPAYAYPSILVVPEAGCWLLKLRTSGRGGVVVMRALAP
ncbi:MAG: hypothetical protein WD249_10295 [Gaiellaceae bacterium]